MVSPDGHDIESRLNPKENLHVSAEDLAKIMVGLVADLADQHDSCSTYIDVYHHEDPEANWPGTGEPGCQYHWFSHMLKQARPYLEVIPPVFNNCTETLS